MMGKFEQIIIFVLSSYSFTQSKMVMPGEPFNPDIYEKALNLPYPAIPYDMDEFDDGTYDDIIQPRIRGSANKWPNGIIPYMLDNEFTEEEKVTIAQAVTIFQNNTCVRVIARTTEENYILLKKNTKSSRCSGFVGMMGGRQVIILANRCVKRIGSTIHELMHTIGFYHEQGRQDRDDFITVHFDNIRSGAKGQFSVKHGDFANAPEYGEYDTLSITHYGRRAFAKDYKKDSMTPKIGNKLGQRSHLTDLDIKKINAFYHCDEKNNLTTNLIPKPPLMPSIDDNGIPMSRKLDTNSSNGNDSRFAVDDLIPEIICKDFDKPLCQKLHKYKYCEMNEMFMSVFCKKTCRKCETKCMDMHKTCTTWANKNYCATYSDYMYHFCPMSCNRCNV